MKSTQLAGTFVLASARHLLLQLEMRERRLSLADASPSSSYSHKEVMPLILDIYSNYSSGSLGFYLVKIIISIAVIAGNCKNLQEKRWK
jgi:hypothetical protein